MLIFEYQTVCEGIEFGRQFSSHVQVLNVIGSTRLPCCNVFWGCSCSCFECLRSTRLPCCTCFWNARVQVLNVSGSTTLLYACLVEMINSVRSSARIAPFRRLNVLFLCIPSLEDPSAAGPVPEIRDGSGHLPQLTFFACILALLTAKFIQYLSAFSRFFVLPLAGSSTAQNTRISSRLARSYAPAYHVLHRPRIHRDGKKFIASITVGKYKMIRQAKTTKVFIKCYRVMFTVISDLTGQDSRPHGRYQRLASRPGEPRLP